MQKLLNILKKPFPEEESRLGTIKNTVLISVFVTFVLYVFQPFGISTLESNKFFICLGFGISTFVAVIIHEFFISYLLKFRSKGERWTFGKWILNNLGIMFSVSLANFLYARILLFGYIDWELFPYMLYSTFMIGIAPIIVIGRFSQMRQERKYQEIAAKINQQPPETPINPEFQDKLLYHIPIRQIKYIEALQNYVKIGYLDDQGQFRHHTERATLKHIQEQTAGSSMIKSHRSFLVNREAIISTSGNAQGLLLTLSDCDKTIPVSRSYVSVFRE
jgi:hypothetical protein